MTDDDVVLVDEASTAPVDDVHIRTWDAPNSRVALLLTVAAAMLIVLTLLTWKCIRTTERLIVEQKRETCYERLAWLAPDATDPAPLGVPRDVAARMCEGEDPRTAFDDATEPSP